MCTTGFKPPSRPRMMNSAFGDRVALLCSARLVCQKTDPSLKFLYGRKLLVVGRALRTTFPIISHCQPGDLRRPLAHQHHRRVSFQTPFRTASVAPGLDERISRPARILPGRSAANLHRGPPRRPVPSFMLSRTALQQGFPGHQRKSMRTRPGSNGPIVPPGGPRPCRIRDVSSP